MKLHKEKESMLGSKLLQKRTPVKHNTRKEKRNELVRNIINNISKVVAGLLIVLVTIELYENIKFHENLYKTISNIKNILSNFIERVLSIVKMKTSMTFPYLENCFSIANHTFDIDLIGLNIRYNDVTQKALGGFVCSMQIIGHMWNINKLNYSLVIDLLWTVFVTTSLYNQFMTGNVLLISSIKVSMNIINSILNPISCFY